jgi:hypothetical protein
MRHFLAVLCAFASVSALAQAVQPDEAQIRERRLGYNHAIADRRPDLFEGFLTPDFVEVYGKAMVNKGAALIARDYAEHVFNDPNFVSYDRRTDMIEFNREHDRAAEHGRFTAHEKSGSGEVCQDGVYQAGWVKIGGVWRIQTEAYIALTKRGEKPCG